MELISLYNIAEKENIKIYDWQIEDVNGMYLNYANIALVMSVKPGFGGQSFIENSLEKILFLKEYREKYNLKYEIEVDGGINAYTSKLCRESGSDILVAGSYIFSSTDYKQKIKELNNENL